MDVSDDESGARGRGRAQGAAGDGGIREARRSPMCAAERQISRAIRHRSDYTRPLTAPITEEDGETAKTPRRRLTVDFWKSVASAASTLPSTGDWPYRQIGFNMGHEGDSAGEPGHERPGMGWTLFADGVAPHSPFAPSPSVPAVRGPYVPSCCVQITKRRCRRWAAADGSRIAGTAVHR